MFTLIVPSIFEPTNKHKTNTTMKNYSISEKVLTISFFILSVSMLACAGLAIIQTLNF